MTLKLKQSLLEATKNASWVVVSTNGKIFGSQASHSALMMAGGVSWILNARDLENFLKYKGYSLYLNGVEYLDEKSFLELIANK